MAEAQRTFSDGTGGVGTAAARLRAVLARRRIAGPWLDSGRRRRRPGPERPTRWHYCIVHPAHRRPIADAQASIDWRLQTAHRGE